eukprot:scaffold35572_cov56-Phaeocystis_antarctica.AAC.1
MHAEAEEEVSLLSAAALSLLLHSDDRCPPPLVLEAVMAAVLRRTPMMGPPYCTHGLRVPAFCVPCVPEAQGSLPLDASGRRTARTPYEYQPRACRTYHVPWHHR